MSDMAIYHQRAGKASGRIVELHPVHRGRRCDYGEAGGSLFDCHRDAWSDIAVDALFSGKAFRAYLSNVVSGTDGKVVNRAVTLSDKDGKPALRFDERGGDGLVQWPDVEFNDGTIEFDVRGKDVLQRSFVGVAFHGTGETYEAVYLRPFNFRAIDPLSRTHAVQYVSMPTYTWDRLRSEHPGQYEKVIDPAPDPNGWVHARIVIAYPKISVFVNNAETPSLVVDQLTDHKSGWIGLWVGNGSGGEFANLKISSAILKRQ